MLTCVHIIVYTLYTTQNRVVYATVTEHFRSSDVSTGEED